MVKLRVKGTRGGPVAATGEGEEIPHRVRPGVGVVGRARGHDPKTTGHLTGNTVRADGPCGLIPESTVLRLDHHMQQVKEGTIWKLIQL